MDCILIHADENLQFRKVLVDGAGASFTRDAPNQRLVIRAKAGELLPKGEHTLFFEYSSGLQTNNVGLYLSRYLDDDGNNVTVVATQFEATSARSAHPCFDEPALKANFSITVDGVPATHTALSNMPVKSVTPNTGGGTDAQPTSKVVFETTPKMSTYLVALVVAPVFGKTVSVALVGRSMNVTAYGMNRASVRSNIAFAAEVGATVTQYYETVFGVNFPLPKQDMIAIPDFAAGAMENWCVAALPASAAALTPPLLSAGAWSLTARVRGA
jgi:aminopeptidase N